MARAINASAPPLRFSHGTVQGWENSRRKAREFATKKDIRVDGAVAVGRGYDDSAEWVMAVHPDRVEVHHLGKVDSLMKKGAKATVLPRGRIEVDPVRWTS